MELTGFVGILRRWWLTLLVAAAAGGVVAWVVADGIEPTYEATTTLLAGDVSADADAVKAAANQSQTYAELAELDPTVDAAAESLGLRPEDFDGEVVADANELTRFVTVAVRDSDRLVARDMANAVAERLALAVEAPGEVVTPGGGVEIREPALLPSSPVEPNVGRVVTLSVIVALVLGVGLVLALEHFDDAVHEPDDLVELAGAGFVTTVSGSRRRSPSGAPLVVDARPGSETAASIRLLATNLELSFEDGAGSVLVVGVERGEGSAEVAANLAASLASPRRRVVLVDSAPDQRVSRLLGFGGRKPAADRESVFEHVQLSHGPGLALMRTGDGAGGVGPLGAEDARSLLRSLRRSADWVIIHAAPALTGANTLVWGSTADATVLVTQRDKTGREPVVTAADAMRRVGASIVGVVLNEGRELRMLRKSRVRKRDGGPERTGASGGSEVGEPAGAGPPHDELLPNGGRQQRVMTANEVDDVLPPAGSPQGPPRQ